MIIYCKIDIISNIYGEYCLLVTFLHILIVHVRKLLHDLHIFLHKHAKYLPSFNGKFSTLQYYICLSCLISGLRTYQLLIFMRTLIEFVRKCDSCLNKDLPSYYWFFYVTVCEHDLVLLTDVALLIFSLWWYR